MNSKPEAPPVSTQRDYYDQYWRTHEHNLSAHEVLRLAEILAAIARFVPNSPGQGLKICDLGCGRGWLAAELTKFGSVTAVDLSPEAVAAASLRWPQVRFLAANILSWRPEEHFDLVVSSEVIEHVPDHQQFADTVRYLLRDGGYLVLTTPNGGVKAAWDAGNQGQQIIENWLTLGQLRRLLAPVQVLDHRVFILDFAYVRLFRFTSAPKLLKLLQAIGLIRLYDFIRELLDLGLYQILVGRIAKSVECQSNGPDSRAGTRSSKLLG